MNRKEGNIFRGRVLRSMEPDRNSAAWLNHAIRYDRNMILESGVDIDWLWKELKIEGRKLDLKRLNLQILIANLINQTSRPIDISMNEKNWNPDYHHATYYQTKELKDIMHQNGYIEVKPGFNEPRPRNTKIWASQKLLEAVTTTRPGIIIKPKNLVELKQNGKRVSYDETPETFRIKKILTKVNEVNSQFDIRYHGYKLHPTLVAIFVDDWQYYGRLHTKGHKHHYQSLKEKQRMKITIDGQKCIEWDYSAIHPHLLYATEKIPLNDDPYSVIDPNPELRPLFKFSLLRMINCANRRSANKSVYDLLTEDYGTYRTYRSLGYGSPKTVIDAILEAHQPIAKYFMRDNKTGLKLMNKDSKIALEVIRICSNKGWPILCVHDSFITMEEHSDELKQIMHRSYSTNIPGFTINVKM